MKYEYIGTLVNTHSLKGEVRIISNFQYKNLIFKKGFKLYIGKNKKCVIIDSYRTHKNYDMCKFIDIDYLEAVKLKGEKVYINRLDISVMLDTDLIGFDSIYLDKFLGKIDDVINNNGYKLFKINNKYIPYNKEFIDNINLEEKKITFKNLEGII